MRAEQIVKLVRWAADGRFTGVIPMRYAYAETHNHFHVLRFDRYSLRDPRTGREVRPDQKTGFCLGDRDETGQPRRHPRALLRPEDRESARVATPQALKVLEGPDVAAIATTTGRSSRASTSTSPACPRGPLLARPPG